MRGALEYRGGPEQPLRHGPSGDAQPDHIDHQRSQGREYREPGFVTAKAAE